METKIIWNNPIIVHHQITRLYNDEETTKGVKQAVALFDDINKKNLKVNLIMDFSKIDKTSTYKMSSHRIWAIGFKENEHIRRYILKTAVVAEDSPKFRAEKEFMETQTLKFFTEFQVAFDWLKSSA